MFAGLGIGQYLILLALALLIPVLVILAFRRASRDLPFTPQGDSSFFFPDTSKVHEAILLVQSGGRIEYLNGLAREWFGVRPDETPDLERIMRQTRPSGDFLDLCANPGQKRLSIGSQLVEATSYPVPGGYTQMLVALKPVEFSKTPTDEESSILRLISDFGRDVSASLDPEEVIHAVLLNVSQLIPSDLLEIKIMDFTSQRLTSYTLEPGGGSVQRVPLSQFGKLTDYLLSQRTPVLVSDTRAPSPATQSMDENSPVQSYIGLPLTADGRLIGTLELGHLTPGALGQRDLDLIGLVLPQVAYSLRNAARYEAEQKRASELSGLASLGQAMSASRDYSNLIQRLIENIAPLFDAEILGFLLYDEEKRTLEAQSPFQGLPPNIVEMYRAPIPPDSPAEAVVTRRKLIVTRDAAHDPDWRNLGLQTISQAASLRESILAPMISGERLVGYLQVSNRKGEAVEFSNSEIRLIEAVAQQAAGIIQSSVTVEQTRQRAMRSDALRRIASLTTSPANVDEILRFSIQELVRLFRGDIAAIFLRDERLGELRLHEESASGAAAETISALSRLHVDAVQYRLTVSGSQKPFMSGRLSADRRVLSVYRPLVTALQVESAVVVPLVVRDQSLGELILGSRKAGYFNEYDLQIISTAANQLASAIDDASRSTLTDERLRLRVEQLTSIARVSRELNSMTDLHSLLQVIHDESLRTTRASCGAIALFDTTASSDPPPVSLSIGCSLPETFPALVREIVHSGEPLVVMDITQTTHQPFHDGIRSFMAVPIIGQGGTVGLIHLHSEEAFHFDDAALEVTQTLASQAAVAIGNVQRYQEQLQRSELLRRRTDTLSRLLESSKALDFEQPLDQSLREIAENITEATPFRAALISVYDPETGLLRRVAGVGFPPDTLTELMTRRQPFNSLQQLLKPQFRISRSYFIPADKSPIIPSDVHMVTFPADTRAQKSPAAWDPDDTLVTVLEDNQGNPLGLISVDLPRDGMRPDRAAIEALEAFALQATLVIMGSARVSELLAQVDALSSGIERQQRLLVNTQNDLPVLLRKDLDQTIAIQNLDQRSQRVRAGLAITESVSRQLDASSALLALARETLTQLGMAVALVAEMTAEGPRLAHVLGSVPRATNPEALFGQRNPLRATLQSGEAILISTLDENLEWRDTPLLTALRAKSLICLPIRIDKRTVAAMMAVSPEPMPAFTAEDLQVYHQIARQTSVILQNLSLLNETRRRLQEVNLLLDFSRQLRGLDSDRIVRALLESARKALNTAHAGVVLIWDEHTGQLLPQAVSGYADNDAMRRIAYRAGESLPGQAFEANRPMRVDEVQFARDYTFSTENQLLYRQATGGRLPVSSLLIPIQSGDQRVGVVVLDNFNMTAAFREEDETLLLSLAQQVGLSLQNVRLVQTTQERAKQLEALTSAATNLTSSLKSTELVETLLDQLEPVLPYDTATLWVREKDRLTVAAARGFPDSEPRLGLTLAVEDSILFKEMIRTGQGILVGDVRQDPRFPTLEAPRLSWLGLPLLSKNEVIGVLALEKWQAYFYTREHVQVGMTFASQSAVALENARLFEDSLNRAAELDERSQRLALLNRFSSTLGGLLDEDKILQLTAQELQAALNAPRVSVVSFSRGAAIWKYSNPKPFRKLPQTLPDAPIFHRLHESLGVFATDAVNAEPDLTPLRGFLGEGAQSLLILPLVSGANLQALMFIHQNEGIRFSLPEIELARTLTNQASIALENARLYQSTLSTAERFAILNQVSYQVSANLDPEQVYAAVHNAAKKLMPVDSFVISLLDEDTGEIEGVYLMDDDRRAPITRIPRDQGLSGRVIASSQPLLIHGVETVDKAGGISYGRTEPPHSILAVPMLLGGRAVGMLSAQSYQPNVHYTEDDLQILSTLANQAIVAIQNGRLLKETQRLAQELEQRVIERTAELQREQQNTETLLRILTEVSSSLDLDRALNRTLALLNDAIGAEQGTIMLRGAEDNMLHYRAGYGYLSDKITGEGRGFKLKIGEGLAGWVVANREEVLIGDLLKDPRWVTTPSSSREHRSAIVVPLLVAEDVIGVLMVFHRKVNFFSAERLNMVKAIAGQVSVAINNAHLYELIRDQAERLGAMLRREQEEASRSQAILEAVADGVLVTGPNNRITFVNPSAEDILDVEAGRLIGQPLDVFAGLFGKAAGSWMQTIRMWSESPSKYQKGETYAEQLDLQNGRIALVHLAPVILQDDFLGTVSIFRDITHEVEVDRLKSEFVATVSHELRTPMTSIRGYTDVLLMGAAGALNENQAHFLNIIKSNTERLTILVNDLLDVSRIESGQVTLSPQALDLREVAEDVIEDVLRRSQEENKPMALSLNAPRKLPPVFADAERVRQVLSNLVFNAYHYTPENGTIIVHIRPLNGGTHVQVDVEDNGVGIAVDDQERIFERFYRGEHPLVLSTPGTGLGLSIVKQIVEMHRGKIWMKSSGIPGEGSTFSFTLPVYEKE